VVAFKTFDGGPRGGGLSFSGAPESGKRIINGVMNESEHPWYKMYPDSLYPAGPGMENPRMKLEAAILASIGICPLFQRPCVMGNYEGRDHAQQW